MGPKRTDTFNENELRLMLAAFRHFDMRLLTKEFDEALDHRIKEKLGLSKPETMRDPTE